jgi:hypothetical protein
MNQDILSEIEGDAKAAIPIDRLTRLRATAQTLRTKQLELEELNRRVNETKSEITKLESRDLVDQFAEAKVKTFELEAEGNYPACKLQTRNIFSSTIPKGGEDAAFALLKELGYADTIRNVVTIELEPDTREAIMKVIGETDSDYTEKRMVLPQTLGRIIRELYEADKLAPAADGGADPMKLLGAYVGTKIELKIEKVETNGKK